MCCLKAVRDRARQVSLGRLVQRRGATTENLPRLVGHIPRMNVVHELHCFDGNNPSDTYIGTMAQYQHLEIRHIFYYRTAVCAGVN